MAKTETALTTPEQQPDGFALALELVAQIPSVEEDPTERMLAAILNAGSVADIDMVFSGNNMKDNVGKRIRVHAIRPLESDYDGPLGFYLVCDVDWLQTGERGVVSCSATMAMAQLLWHHTRQQLPWDFEIVAKKKATKAGFTPIHLLSLGRPASAHSEG